MMRLLAFLSFLAFSHSAPLSELTPTQLLEKLSEYELTPATLSDISLSSADTSMQFCQDADFADDLTTYVMVWDDGPNNLINFPGNKNADHPTCADFPLGDDYPSVFAGSKIYKVFAVKDVPSEGIQMQAQLEIAEATTGNAVQIVLNSTTTVYRGSVSEDAQDDLQCYESYLADAKICYTEEEAILGSSQESCSDVDDGLGGDPITVCQSVDASDPTEVEEGTGTVNYLAYPINDGENATLGVTATAAASSVEVIYFVNGIPVVIEGTSTGMNSFDCSVVGFEAGTEEHTAYIVEIDANGVATSQSSDTIQDINLLCSYYDPYLQFVLSNEDDDDKTYQVVVEDPQMRAVGDPITLDCTRIDDGNLCFGFVDSSTQTDGYIALAFAENENVIKIPFSTSASRSNHAKFQAIIENLKQFEEHQGEVRLY